MTGISNYSAGPSINSQARLIRLGREVRMLSDLVAELTPYQGALPETFDQYQALPDPHRRQVAREHAEHVARLEQVEALLAQAEQQDRRTAERQAALAGLPVDSPAAFAALGEAERAALALTLTRRQRLALAGEEPEPDDGAYL